jgi:hypothetical protein
MYGKTVQGETGLRTSRLVITDHISKDWIRGTVEMNKTISNYCYSGDTGLKDFSVEDDVAEIGIGAFSNCVNLEKVILNDKIRRLKKEVFSGCCSLREINIPEGLESIGEWAFRDCRSLRMLAIPDSVTDICAESFLSCPDLTIIAKEGSFAAEFARRMGIPLAQHICN